MYKFLMKRRSAERPFLYIFISALFLAFHYFLVTYINSTYLGKIIPTEYIGFLYAGGAVINIFLFLYLPRILRRFSNYNTILVISVIEIALLCILAVAKLPLIIIIAFVLHATVTPALLMCLDISIEDYANPKSIGKIRGMLLTIIGVASVISPLIVGSFIVDSNGFEQLYLFSCVFMVLFALTVWRNFKTIPSGTYKEVNIKRELLEFLRDKNIKAIMVCNIILQFFFSWMVIYIPLYLLQVAGFMWSEIGIIISITLLPFILLEIPVGELADNRFGEKEMLVLGLSIAAIALLLFPFISAGNFIAWTAVLFIVRAGASVIETMIESYFFKKTKQKDELITVFRMGTPIAFIIGPVIGSIGLFFLPFTYLFTILSIVLAIGIVFALKIKDTR